MGNVIIIVKIIMGALEKSTFINKSDRPIAFKTFKFKTLNGVKIYESESQNKSSDARTFHQVKQE